MLKWLVTGKDREDTSVRIFDDTLDEVKVEENDHYNKIYCINRVNPLFQHDDPHIKSPSSQGLSKNSDLYRTSSCSSGYGSSISQDQLGNISLSFISREDKAYSRQKLETGNLLIPPPIWPGLRRIHSWLQFEELNEADTKQLVSEPEDRLQKVYNTRVDNGYSEDSDSHSEFDKTSLVAREKKKQGYFVNSRGIHSVGKHRAKSRKRKDLRNLHLKHTVSLPKHTNPKIWRASTGYANRNSSVARCAITDKKKHEKEKLKNAREQISSSPKYMSTLELSALNLSDPSSYPASYSGHYPQQFRQTRVQSQSSSWLLPSRDAMESSLYPWAHSDPDHGVWVEEKWRHQLSSTPGYLDESEEKEKNNSYMLKFCKSFCFLLLLTTFVMVIVTVSVFLSRGTRQLQSSL